MVAGIANEKVGRRCAHAGMKGAVGFWFFGATRQGLRFDSEAPLLGACLRCWVGREVLVAVREVHGSVRWRVGILGGSGT